MPVLPAADPAKVPVLGASAGSPAPAPAVATPPPPPTGPRPDQPRPGLGTPGTTGAAGTAGIPQDPILWIHQRIAAIQQERETRWQKIVKLLPGMS